MRIFSGRYFRDKTLLFSIEVDEHKCGKYENTNHTITTEGGRCSEVVDKHSTDNSPTTSSESVMQSLEHSCWNIMKLTNILENLCELNTLGRRS